MIIYISLQPHDCGVIPARPGKAKKSGAAKRVKQRKGAAVNQL